MVSTFTSISLLSVGLSLRFFTEEGSYQGLKDATSFGLLSDKSTEILGSEYSDFCQFSILADSAIFRLHGDGLNLKSAK